MTTLYVPGDSPVHRLPAQCKVVALLAFVFTVVATPRTAVWAFFAYALLLASLVALARLPVGTVLRRMIVETPFVLFAVLLPFVATGPRVDVLGVGLSEPGLWGAWNVLAKATLGVVASIVLAATTEQRALLAGLERLRLPRQLVQIASFTIRYAEVIADQMARMRVARASRGFEPRGPRSWSVLGRSVGALFIRSYERGERVHLAMLSRGYSSERALFNAVPASRGQWLRASTLPVVAVAIGGLAWLM